MSRREDAYTSLDEVEVVRRTAKAYLCRWQDHERFVPISQIHPDHDDLEPGEVVELRVRSWLADKWMDGDDGRSYVTVENVAVVRESQKAIQVAVGGRDENVWVPKFALAPDSEVKIDGDSGMLRLLENIAREKGLAGGDGSAEEGPSAGEAVRGFDWGDGSDDIPF